MSWWPMPPLLCGHHRPVGDSISPVVETEALESVSEQRCGVGRTGDVCWEGSHVLSVAPRELSPRGALLGVACHLLCRLTGLTVAGTALSYTSAVGMSAVGLGVPEALYSRSWHHRSTGVRYQGHTGCALRAAVGAASTPSTRAHKARGPTPVAGAPVIHSDIP